VEPNDVARLVAEQKPDPAAPCPHCGRPIIEDRNIVVRGYDPRLLARCGGSGLDYTGRGCFEEVAWDPDRRRWVPS